jgi:nicotinamidase-related amidase
MPLDPRLVEPERTAVVLNEMQRGTVGDLSTLPQLAESAAPAVAAAARLVRAARAAGVQVVHCVAGSRVDYKGSMRNTLFGGLRAREAQSDTRTEDDVAAFAEVVPEIGVEPEDLFFNRLHSMSPMTDTGLDLVLRNEGIANIIAGGVSLNVGVMGLVIEAANRTYNVVLPRDMAAGVPPEYGQMVLDNSLRFVSRLTTVDEILAIWSA